MVAETLATLTLRATYAGVKEVSEVLARAEEDGELDFDFSVEIWIDSPKGGTNES
jgi:hypothetical protein